MHGENSWRKGQTRRVSRRRLLAAAAAGGVALSGAGLLACGSRTEDTGRRTSGATSQVGTQAAQEQPRSGGTLNAYITLNPVLDPHKTSSLGQQAYSGVMSRLFRFKVGLDPNAFLDHDTEPDLAVSLESPDAVTWTVKLRPGAKFHNIPPVSGHAVEAEDIKATFTRALDPAIGNPNRGALGMIDPNQIQTPDTSTIVFRLNYPYAPFPKLLASPTYSLIFPREVLTGAYDPAKQVIGSGPFIMESATPDVAYTYKKNPEWFGQGQPYVDGLKLAFIVDQAQQMAQFSVGNLDEITAVNVFDVPTVTQNNPKALHIKAQTAAPGTIAFQLGDPTSPFQDIRVRRAFSMAIDRDALSKAVYGGEAIRVVWVPAYMGKWALHVDKLDPSIKQYYQHNPGETKKLLEAAGASNLQIRLANPFASLGNQTTATTVEVLNNMFNAAGIKSTILSLDYNRDFIAGGKGIRQGNFDKDMVVWTGIANYTEADEFLFVYFHSKSTSNQEKLSDPMLDAMIDKQRTLVNEAERLKAVQDIQTYIAEKLYMPSTVGGYTHTFIQPRVQNYQYTNALSKMAETYAGLWLKA